MRAAAPTVLAAATLALAGCATAGLRPPSSVVERAAVARSYSGRLRVTLRGPDLRGRMGIAFTGGSRQLLEILLARGAA